MGAGWVVDGFFDFGQERQTVLLGNYKGTTDLNVEVHVAGEQKVALQVADAIQPGQWCHLGLTLGAAGIKVYLNGALVVSNEFTGSFKAVGNSGTNYLGRNTWKSTTPAVDDFAGQNRIERGDLCPKLESVDLSRATRNVVEAYQARAGAKEQRLSFENQNGPVIALADTTQLIQVIENLVSNAVKYSPRGKEVTVRVGSDGGLARCEVRDQGPGLSAEDQKRLFGKFARLSARPTGGELATGLGLSIVKRMVEAMNGRVWCESALGEGARFVVTLPAGASPR